MIYLSQALWQALCAFVVAPAAPASLKRLVLAQLQHTDHLSKASVGQLLGHSGKGVEPNALNPDSEFDVRQRLQAAFPDDEAAREDVLQLLAKLSLQQ